LAGLEDAETRTGRSGEQGEPGVAMEGVARRDFRVRVKEKMLLAGFVVLMMLMVTVIYNDLTRVGFFGRLMPWR